MPLVPKEGSLQFEDVGQAFRNEIKSNKGVLVILVLLALGGIVLGRTIEVLEVAGFIAIFPVLAWFAFSYSKQKKLFMEHIAAAYDFMYVGSSTVDPAYVSRLFTLGHSRNIEHMMMGVYESHPVKVFHYQFVTGSGKNQQTHPYTVCIVDMGGPLPDFVLEENRFWSTDGLLDRNHKKIELEGSFNEKFKVYVSEDLEVEALQILTPEIMEWLMEKGSGYSMEFKNNLFYLVENGHLTTRTDLTRFIEFAAALIDTLGSRFHDLMDDVVAAKETKNRQA